MKLTRLRLTKEASNRLKILSGRTGLTPNLLCRVGFCLSLREAGKPEPARYPEEEREFNRFTLLGEYDALFVALLRQRCFEDGSDPSQIEDLFRAHMNRGVSLLYGRARSIGDLGSLVGGSERHNEPAV
jgi:DNA sulfur modification protein DndE